MPAPFNSADWYWFVGGSTNVYSSKRNTYVPTGDATYTSWLTMMGFPAAPPIGSEEEIWYYVNDWQPWWLYDTVAKTLAQPTATTYTKQQLHNYNSDKRVREVDGGMTAAGIPVRTDQRSRMEINSSRAQAVSNPNFTTQWYGSDGNFYPVDAPTMIAMADAVAKHTNDCFAVFKQMDDGITLNTTTTIAQIDTAYVGL
jgi:Domain of unknown function (DUF4376)